MSVQMKGVGTARTSSKTQIYVWNFNSVKYFRGFILKGSMFKQRLHGLNIYRYETCLNVCLWVDLRHRTVPLTVDMVLRKNEVIVLSRQKNIKQKQQQQKTLGKVITFLLYSY